MALAGAVVAFRPVRGPELMATDRVPAWLTLRPAALAVAPGCMRSREGEHPADPRRATVPGFAQIAHGLDPAEHLLDPLAHPQAGLIAGVAYRAPIDGRATLALGVGRHMGNDLSTAQEIHKTARVKRNSLPAARLIILMCFFQQSAR